MHDRLSTEVLPNGAVRYGIYNAEGTLLEYKWIKLEDDPLAIETALIASNMLTELTAASIWKAGDAPADPTVDQALMKLTEPQYAVGDILVTARLLSAPWHLCDGSTFSQTTYPDLYTALGGTILPNINYSDDTGTYIKMAHD